MVKSVLIAIFMLGAVLLMPSNVLAQAKYQIKQMTPEVTAALEGRRSRFDILSALKVQGAVGENNHGYVEVLSQNNDAQSIADAENKDRKVIYETIAKQNGLEGALETIEKVFAQVQREKAAAGSKVQDNEGNWITK